MANFVNCDFINTEVNHDFGKAVEGSNGTLFPITAQKNSTQIRASIRSNVDICRVDNRQDSRGRPVVLNDEEIVQIFLRMSKADFINGVPDAPVATGVLTSNGGYENVFVQKCTKALTANGKNMWTNSLPGLFSGDNYITGPPQLGTFIPLFFVIDTGGEIIKAMKGLTPTTFPLHLNILNSPATIGDSAGKTNPVAKIYKNSSPSIIINSWLYKKTQRQFFYGHEDFMSSYNIQMGYNTTNDNFVSHNWINPTTNAIVFGTGNANIDNNITSCAARLTDLIPPDDMAQFSGGVDKGAGYWNREIYTGTGIIRQDDVSITLQRKRSGDHLQILFAKYFSNNSGSYSPFENFFDLGVSSNEAIQEIAENGRGATLSEPLGINNPVIRLNNTYFVTIDWPALCFALYNKINVIFIHANTGTCIKFKWNR